MISRTVKKLDTIRTALDMVIDEIIGEVEELKTTLDQRNEEIRELEKEIRRLSKAIDS